MSNKKYKSNLSKFRDITHQYLDGIWKMSYRKGKARTNMYSWLAVQMDIPKSEAHISKFDIAKCIQAINILKPKYIQLYGKDIEFKKEGSDNMITVTEQIDFETAYILSYHDNLYSHSYKIAAEVTGPEQNEYGMIISYEELQEALRHIVFDHMYIFGEGDIISEEISKTLKKFDIPYKQLPFKISDENLVKYFAGELQNYLKTELGYPNIELVQLTLFSMDNNHGVKWTS